MLTLAFIKAIVNHLDTFMSESNRSWYQIDSKHMYVMKELWTKKFLNYFEDADEIFIQLASGDTNMQILENLTILGMCKLRQFTNYS